MAWARLGLSVVLAAAVLVGLACVEALAEPALYPSVPFALGGMPGALALPDFNSGASPGDILVGQAGRVVSLRPRPDGVLVPGAPEALPESVVPAAIGVVNGVLFVLDPPNRRVLVAPQHGPSQSLAVGADPAAMAVDAAGEGGNGAVVIVANAGSGDLSVYEAKKGLAFGPETRVATGSRPRAMLWTDNGLAVANSGDGTVALFSFNLQGRLKRYATDAVGGAPSSLAEVDDDAYSDDLGGDPGSDLVVGDAENARVTVLRNRGYRFRAAPPVELPLAASTAPLALAVGDFDRDDHPDVGVGDRGSQTVLVVHGTRHGSFAHASVVRSGVDPVGLVGGNFDGDEQDDLVLADARSQSVVMLPTPGDRLIAPTASARYLAAGAPGVFWSQPDGHGRYRLRTWDGHAVHDVPVRPSAKPFRPRVGRRGPRRPVVSFARCEHHGCSAYEWDVGAGRERRVALRTPRGCTVREVAIWDRRTAYVLTRAGRGSCDARGLWLAQHGRHPHRVAPAGRFIELGSLRGRRLGWNRYGAETGRLRVLTIGRHARTFDRSDFDCCPLTAPQLDGRRLYWAAGPFEGVGPWQLVRNRLGHPFRCPQAGPLIPTRFLDEDGDFAVRRGRIYYATEFGVFRLDPDRLRWRADGSYC